MEAQPPSTPPARVIRVLIVEDQQQVREDLHLLLALSGDLEIIGEAGNGQEALDQMQILQPDVVLMDLEMPVMNGYEAARRIKQQSYACRVIALSIHNYPSAWQRAAQAGVDGFIAKGAPLDVILDTIKERKS